MTLRRRVGFAVALVLMTCARILYAQVTGYTATYSPGGKTETFAAAAMTCNLADPGGSNVIKQGAPGSILLNDPANSGKVCAITSTVVATLAAGSYTATVTATNASGTSGPSNTASFTIQAPATLLTLSISGPSSGFVGTSAQFIATGTYSDKTTQDLTSAVTWASSSLVVASIASNGLATLLSAGATNISATSGSVVSPPIALAVTQPATSPSGTILPPATQIVDTVGNAWTLGSQTTCNTFGDCGPPTLRNGTWVGQGLGTKLEWCSAKLYVLGVGSAPSWFIWSDPTWTYINGDPTFDPCGVPPPPPPLAIMCPANRTVQSATPIAVTYPDATFTGGMSPVSTISSPPSGTVFPLGVNTVTDTATDSTGQSKTCTWTISVTVPVPPPLVAICPTAPAPVTSATPVAVTYGPVTANGGTAPIQTVESPASGSLFAVGTTPVVGAATDSAGMKSTCAFNVTVVAPPACTSTTVRVNINGYQSTAKVGVPTSVALSWTGTAVQLQLYLTDNVSQAVITALDGLTISNKGGTLNYTPKTAGTWNLYLKGTDPNGCTAATGIIRKVTVTP